MAEAQASPPPGVAHRACAACGTTSGRLLRCECRLVVFCSKACQRSAWRKHRPLCVPRPLASRGDCPVCLEPLSRTDPREAVYKECCGTKQCRRCQIAQYEAAGETTSLRACAFCRAPCASSPDVFRARLEKRANEHKDATAYFMLFVCHTRGMCEFPVSRELGLRYLRRAAELGHPDAQFDWAAALHRGEFVLPKSHNTPAMIKWPVDQNVDEAQKLYETVVKRRAAFGLPMACLYLGTIYYHQNDDRRAAQCYAEAAALGGIETAFEFYQDLAKANRGGVSDADVLRVQTLFQLAREKQKQNADHKRP